MMAKKKEVYKVKPLNENKRIIIAALIDLSVLTMASLHIPILPWLFIAQYNYQKLQSEMENIASPKWRKLQRIF